MGKVLLSAPLAACSSLPVNREMFEFGSKDGPERSNQFKYVLDVSCSVHEVAYPR